MRGLWRRVMAWWRRIVPSFTLGAMDSNIDAMFDEPGTSAGGVESDWRGVRS